MEIKYKNKNYYDFWASLIDTLRIAKRIDWFFTEFPDTNETERMIAKKELAELQEGLKKAVIDLNTWAADVNSRHKPRGIFGN